MASRQFISNSFAVTRLPTKVYYMYDVFQPEIEQREKAKRNQLFHHLQVTVAPDIFNPRLVYDGNAIAYSPGLLNLGGNSGVSFNIRLGTRTQITPGTRGSYQIKLNLTSSPPIYPSDVKDLIYKGLSSTCAATATNLMQLIVLQAPNMHHTNNGRAYFTGRDVRAIDKSGIELWRGIFQSVRPTLGKMVVTIDTSTAAVYKSGSLISVAIDFLQARQIRDLDLSPRDVNFQKLERFLKRVRIKVQTGVNGRQSRIKTIRGLEPKAGRFTFQKENGDETTVEDYFRQAYGIHIMHPRIIGVRLTGKHSTHQDIVPAELCYIEPGQLFRQKIPDMFVSDMVRFSTMLPHKRLEKILAAADAYNRSDYIVEAGMALDSKPLTVTGKILDPPEVHYGDEYKLRVDKGAWNVMEKSFFDPRPLHSWAIINFCPERINPNQCRQISQDLMQSCRNLGMDIRPPHNIFPCRGQAVERDLHAAMNQIDATLRHDPNYIQLLANTLLIILLPSNAAPIRAAVKQWGDTGYGIKTSCLRENNVARAKSKSEKSQYWNNVALKLNARIGGINSMVDSPAMQSLQEEPFIIMGADVGHPGPGIQKPSITSLVYSHERYAVQYVALTAIQDPRTEIIENLQAFVEEALCSWLEKNGSRGHLPRKVIMFRDGVSEGEYEAVSNKEIAAIEGAFRAIWGGKGTGKWPKLTFIVVTKRHHTVFFPLTPQEGDSKGNCHPGSVIDRDITHPGYPNFYLQSHAGIQGTCRSSHYIVLKDESFNSAANLSEIQDLAYSLCHVYAKATRSVSIPAPVYYADLVCSRGAFHIPLNAGLSFDEGTSVSSHGPTFNLSDWQEAFKQVKKTATNFEKSMYFL